jgi:CheY-like chemotaxis protein
MTNRRETVENKPIALIVEDDVDAAYIFGLALQKAGFEVQVAHTGDRALELLESLVPTLVVLDLSLPGVSGILVLENIRNNLRLSETFVILATAYAHLAQAVKDQSDLVLMKPVSSAQLSDLSKRLVTTVH